MPQAQFSSIGIRGITTVVPTQTESMDDLAGLYQKDPAQLDRLKKVMQLDKRRIAPDHVTTLDLCEHAARDLLGGLNVNPQDIDAILCVTQTPDHLQPSNANILHGRLSLAKHAAAFDINQGCSGWVYGLYIASTMLSSGGCRNVLLLAGDTIARLIHPLDKSCRPLFGDAGSATLVSNSDQFADSWFSLHSDGRGWNAIQQPEGGFRNPSGTMGAEPTVDAEGNYRCGHNLHMSGLEVFNFTLREEPAALKQLLAFANTDATSVDYFVLHQANAFILSNIAKRLQIPAEKMPMNIAGKFGNQSSASIPATVCHNLNVVEQQKLRLLFSGFGVGLSWASALMELGPSCRTRLIEMAC
ncbi:MAG: ketoacyl-ACP synthase III [Verrucomicrobia bacterium]|nr:ketoacyl-ACP synthase III [Verrucomicrobiota bacterium]